MYFTAEHEGRVLPYRVSSEPGKIPDPLVFEHTTSSISPLASGLLLSMSSMTSPLDYFLLLDATGKEVDEKPRKVHRLTSWGVDSVDGRLDGLEAEEYWFEGSEGWAVMGWVNKPLGWKAGDEKKWPLGESLMCIDVYSFG